MELKNNSYETEDNLDSLQEKDIPHVDDTRGGLSAFLQKHTTLAIAAAIFVLLVVGGLVAFSTSFFAGDQGGISENAIFVSANGDDANPGTRKKPVQTLAHARDMVRTMNGGMSADIHVYLREGTYVLPEPLTLDERDSGSNGFDIIYEAYNEENVVISGGRTITEWEEAEGNLIKANVGDLDTRQLFVNGKRAIRARSNDALIADIYKVPVNNSEGYTTTNLDLQNWQNKEDIEFVYRSKVFWPEHRCGVESIEGGAITMQQPCFSRANILGQKQLINGMQVPTFIENAFELLDEPGEWYLNKQTGILYYYPLAVESVEDIEAIAPELELLVHGKGSDDESPIHNIQFKNLQFSYATWLGINDHGFPNEQAGIYSTGEAFQESAMMPANVTFERAEDIVFEGNTFTHLGAAGINFTNGPKRITIRGNTFTDISGSAIQLGDHRVRNPQISNLIVEDNDISYNRIHDAGTEYAFGVGIFIAFAASTTIEHNELYDLPHCGISIGWAWDPGSTAAENNKIRYNYVHDFLGVNGDCGGIYTLGFQPGSEIAYNVVMNQSNRIGGGIYLDQGSQGIDVHNNVLFNNQPNLNINSPGQLDLHDNWWQNRSSVVEEFSNRKVDDVDLLGCAEQFGEAHCEEPQTQLYDNNIITSLDDVLQQMLDEAGINGVSCEGGICEPETEILLCTTDCAESGNGICESGEFSDTAPSDCALPGSADSATPDGTTSACVARCLDAGDPRSVCGAYCANQ